MSETPVARLIPGTESLVWEWRPGSPGFFLGTPLEVPPRHTAVVMLRGEVLDLFLPGSYLLDVQHLPLLCQRTRVGDGRQPVPARIYKLIGGYDVPAAGERLGLRAALYERGGRAKKLAPQADPGENEDAGAVLTFPIR